MNASEAAILLGVCAAYDRRTVGEIDAMAWAEALADIRLDDAKIAVVHHYRDSDRWIMPAHVRQIVKDHRRARLAHEVMPAPDPTLAENALAYKAALDRSIDRIASGWNKGLALEAGQGAEPNNGYLAARGQDPHRDLRIAALPSPCPHCKAAPGDRCINAAGTPLSTEPAHEARLVAAGLARWVEVRGVRRAELLAEAAA